jgi:hypothetical protein
MFSSSDSAISELVKWKKDGRNLEVQLSCSGATVTARGSVSGDESRIEEGGVVVIKGTDFRLSVGTVRPTKPVLRRTGVVDFGEPPYLVLKPVL